MRTITRTARYLTVATLSCIVLTGYSSPAATVPSGTALIVRPTGTISSHDRVGRTFPAELVQDVSVNGKILLKAGTKATLRVETSGTSGPLSVNLENVMVNGKKVATKTAEAFHPRNKGKTARRRAASVSSGSLSIAPGTEMEFHLAQPLHL